MKKTIKFIRNNILGILVGLSLCLNGVIIAENMLSSEQVSYTNEKTSETTVKGNLYELFSAVDINERLGSIDISAIGDGTVPGAITDINSNLTNLSDKFQYIYGYTKPGENYVVEYPTGFNFNNSMIIGIRVSTPYGTITDNNYSDSYKINVVLWEDSIQITNHENNNYYTEYIITIMKIEN